jgi:uncharacterized membrane protein YjjB (DUF3815 family)
MMGLLGGMAFSVNYRIPRKYFIHAALIACIAKLLVEFMSVRTHVAFATFVAALFVGVVSHLFARIVSKPAQAFLIPGVVYLLPGTALYRSFSFGMLGDLIGTAHQLTQAVLVTAAISFALLMANWVVPPKRTL